MVERAIRRELSEEDSGEGEVAHRHRLPLGLILLAQGWITNPQLQHALSAQRLAGDGRIGDWLVAECGLKEDRLIRGLGMQWGCPVLPMDGFVPEAMALTVPKALLAGTAMVPLRMAGKRILYLGFEDCLDAAAAFAMERMSGLTVESGLVDGRQLLEARRHLCACDFVESVFQQVADIDALSQVMSSALSKMQPRASRLVRVHQFFWLRMWLETGAMTSREGGVPMTREDVADRVYAVGREQ
jgi:hypothetical protein